MLVLATDYGAHPPEKWAIVTAEQIFPITRDMESSRLLKAKRIQMSIIEVLFPLHQSNQENERATLKRKGSARLSEEHGCGSAAEKALAAIIPCIKGTPWEEKTNDPAWRTLVAAVIEQHLVTAVDIERQWHCLRNPNDVANDWLRAKHAMQEEAV